MQKIFLIDMGFFMSRSLFRVTKEDGEFADKYTDAQRADLDFMATEGTKDFWAYLKDLVSNTKPIDEETGKFNYFILCFDDNTYQVRPSYKQRDAVPATVKVIKQKMYEQFMEKLKNTKSIKIANGLGMEADDWAFNLSRLDIFKDADITVVTSDRDWICNITDNTKGIFYGKTTAGLSKSEWNEDILNFKDYAKMPYNAIWLYKITVGDKSDSIDGVHLFGPSAFNKMIEEMKADNFPFETLHDIETFENFIYSDNGLSTYLGHQLKKTVSLEEGLKQARYAWSLVRPVLKSEAIAYANANKDTIAQKIEARKQRYIELNEIAKNEIAEKNKANLA